jgi:4-diphosphocytidyl-2-C-methyl-D-erythritol kinase
VGSFGFSPLRPDLISAPEVLQMRAPAKLNLHLEVLGLRPDGFHELAMVMQTIDLFDQISVTAAKPGEISLECTDNEIALDGSNLVIKAATALQNHTKQLHLGAKLQLVKNIPIGAGLAGGSSDAATTLLLLNRFWQLHLPLNTLELIASELGSDVPFCLIGGTQCCYGRGEKLQACPDALPLGVLLLKDPSAQVSTPWAYGKCKELRSDFYLEAERDFEQRREQLRHGKLLQWLGKPASMELPPLRNDLQGVVAPGQPSVEMGINLLRQLPNLITAAMSGSGPSIFGLFRNRAVAAEAEALLLPALRENGFNHWVCGFEPARSF